MPKAGTQLTALVPSRTTRGQAQRLATATQALAVANLARAAEEEARDQARGPEGRQTLHDRCVEAREAANQLHDRKVARTELARDRLGQWQQATEDGASNGGAQPTVCTERPGWTAVRDLWERAGSAAADLFMEWPDRNQVWRQVEVTLIGMHDRWNS